MSDHDDKGFIIGLMIGGLIGAAAMFLFGTKKGEEVREDLRKKGEDILENLDGILKQLEEKSREVKKQAEKVKEQIAQKAGEVKENLSEEMTEKLDDTLAKIENLQDRGREVTANLRKKYFTKDGKKLA